MSKLAKVEKCVQKGKEEELIRLSQDKEKKVRVAAIAGHGQVGKGDAYNHLVTMMEDEDPEIRIACIKALGVMKDAAADTPLRHQMSKETDEEVKAAIRDTLAILPREKY